VIQLGFLGFMAGTASRKNGELGGRPPGRKNDKTLEREAELERLRQRVFQATDVLVDAQLGTARGRSYLFKADTDEDGKAGKPILVDDPVEIAAYLVEDYNELETTYYYITTEKLDTRLYLTRCLQQRVQALATAQNSSQNDESTPSWGACRLDRMSRDGGKRRCSNERTDYEIGRAGGGVVAVPVLSEEYHKERND
jgi:hypothetical protein